MPTKKREAEVDSPSMAHNTMSVRWNKINALLGGTEAMRAAGELYMPRHQEEDTSNWQNRLARSVLTNVFKRTLRSLSGRPFTEEIRKRSRDGEAVSRRETASVNPRRVALASRRST